MFVFVAWVFFSISKHVHAGDEIILDQVVHRFVDPEGSHQFYTITQHDLILNAWLIAYEKPGSVTELDPKTIDAARERCIVEILLSKQPLPKQVQERLQLTIGRVQAAQLLVIGGQSRFDEMLSRIATDSKQLQADFTDIWRRRAQAELYVEHFVIQPLQPSEHELRIAYKKAPESIAKRSFEQAKPALKVWLHSVRLRESMQSYYQAIRTKLKVE